jgi:hypothetical protein
MIAAASHCISLIDSGMEFEAEPLMAFPVGVWEREIPKTVGCCLGWYDIDWL